MRRFIPLLIASAALVFGGGGLIVHYELNATDSAGASAWMDERDAFEQLKSEKARSRELDERLVEVGQRLNCRWDATRRLYHGTIDMPTAFEVYRKLNWEARDPLHFEGGGQSEFARLSWIATQIRVNLDNAVPDDGSESSEARRRVLAESMAWMLAEVVDTPRDLK